MSEASLKALRISVPIESQAENTPGVLCSVITRGRCLSGDADTRAKLLAT